MGKKLKVGDLFAGIGGFSLGLERAGMETAFFCEIEPFCQKVLKKNWPAVPIYEDVRNLDYDRSIDVICGGYPCQPFSNTGKRKGKKDDRHLWPAMLEQIQKLKPSWVICENVRGHFTLGLDEVLLDLEKSGYSWWAGIIPASSIGAYHSRQRIWIVANNDSQRMEGCFEESLLRLRNLQSRQAFKPFQENERVFNSHQSRLCRSLYGLPSGVDRVKALGNAVVPQIPEALGRAILEVERIYGK